MIRFPASTKKGGIAASFPDVCKTPAAPSPIPVPYPNIGRFNGTDKTCNKVLMSKKETVVESSKISRSNGDEAGSLGGMKSSVNMNQCGPKKYSSKVFAKGKKIVNHTAPTAQNGSSCNIIGCHTVPSQTKVLVSP